MNLYLVNEGDITPATAETEWDGVNSVLVAATSEFEARLAAAAYDRGEIQADNVWLDGKSVAAVQAPCFHVTDVQLFDCSGPDEEPRSRWSANIAINDEFMLQRGTDGEFSIPSSNNATWNDDEKQDWAAENIDADELAAAVDANAALAAATNWI